LKTREAESIRTVPMDGAHIDVREAMEGLVQRQNRGVTGVTREHMIILHVQSPHVPTLDLVDLPGVVTVAGPGEPDDMPQQTQALVQDCIRESKDHSLFLCTVPATIAPNSSTGLQLLKQEGVLDRTVGVLTMCDDVAPRHQPKLRARLAQTGDAVVLKPYGWVATMNCPVEMAGPATNYARLLKQAEAEPGYFVENRMGDLVEGKSATTNALLEKVNGMFLQYLKASWLPTTMRKLKAEKCKIADAERRLGLPVAGGNLSLADLSPLRQQAAEIITEALESGLDWMLGYFFRTVVQKLSASISALSEETSLELSGTAGHRDKMAATVQEACAEAQRASQDTFVKMVETLLAKAETEGSFHIMRFPKTVQLVLQTVAQICQDRSEELQGYIEDCIYIHFGASASHTVHVVYDHSDVRTYVSMLDDLKNAVGTGSIKAKVIVDVARIRADFVHIFVTYGAAVLKSDLSDHEISKLVKTTIVADTVESRAANSRGPGGPNGRLGRTIPYCRISISHWNCVIPSC
jgi:hypothetical protein